MSSSQNTTPARQGILRHPITRAALPFLIGGSSGIVATTCIQPIDMVKVRIQLLGEGTHGGPRPNPFTVARSIVAQGNILSLWQGLSAGYLRQVVYGTSRLGFFFTFENLLKERASQKGTNYGFSQRALAGLAAGGLGAAIGNPAEVCLIRMQSDGLKPISQRANYRSVFDALARITRSEGVRGLWAGSYPTIIRAMSTNFGQLAFFSEAKHQLQLRTGLSTQNRTIAASAIAGFFAAFFSLPFDFVKTRLQRQTKGKDGKMPYKGMMDVFVKVAKKEGLLRFYRGFGTYFMRIAPHSVITLIVADNITWFIASRPT